MKVDHNIDFPKRNIEEFIRELSELSKKYQLYISACGCCKSPHILYKTAYEKDMDILAENLKFNKTEEKYTYENFEPNY
jgi:hypothetical protein